MRHFFPFPDMESLEMVVPNPKLNSVPPEMGQVSLPPSRRVTRRRPKSGTLAKLWQSLEVRIRILYVSVWPENVGKILVRCWFNHVRVTSSTTSD